jgi:hypothetical protein
VAWETRILSLLPSVIEIVLTTFWIVLMTLTCPSLAAACHCPTSRALSLVHVVTLEEVLVVVLISLLRAVGVLAVMPVLGHQALVLGGVAS